MGLPRAARLGAFFYFVPILPDWARAPGWPGQRARPFTLSRAPRVGELIVVRQDRLRGMDFLQSSVFVGREFDKAPIPVRMAEGVRIADPNEKTGAIIHFPIPDAVKIACGQQAVLSRAPGQSRIAVRPDDESAHDNPVRKAVERECTIPLAAGKDALALDAVQAGIRTDQLHGVLALVVA